MAGIAVATAVLLPLASIAVDSARASTVTPADDSEPRTLGVLETLDLINQTSLGSLGDVLGDPLGAIETITSSIQGSDGKQYSIINHLDKSLLDKASSSNTTNTTNTANTASTSTTEPAYARNG